MWKDIIYLLSETTALDEYKRPYKVETSRKVYAHKKSVRSSEFYQAQATGLKPELVFVVRSYNGEQHITYQSKRYRVLRSYEIGGTTELTVTTSLTEEYS